MNRFTTLALLSGLLGLGGAQATDLSCKTRYPLVLSHVWSIAPICRDPEATGAKSCENTLDYERLCAVKKVVAPGEPRKCLKWQVPDDELDLPPRNTNVFEPGLTRDVSGYNRHFSKAIVSRLRDTCGNAVFIADKPPFASYEVRARVLRDTVRLALAQTGADKVNVIGMSQGVQDARYMSTALPMDPAQPQGPRVSSRLASIVSLVGEDAGAEMAGLGLETVLLLNGGQWSRVQDSFLKDSQPAITAALWRQAGAPGTSLGQLVEHCQSPQECDASQPETQYRWLLRSLVDLSPAFMKPNWLFSLSRPLVGWRNLTDYVWQPDASWSVKVPPSAEAHNGVHHMSYAAWMRKPTDILDAPESYYLLSLFVAKHDGYVSVASQQFPQTASNFENVRLLKGPSGSVGYHHMFFSGRNDRMYGPVDPAQQEAAPYGGSSADFWQQLARDLRARGL